VFLFANARRNRLKLVFFDGSGLWVCAKRMEGGRLRWPERDSTEEKMVLSHEELALLLGGIDLERTRRGSGIASLSGKYQRSYGYPHNYWRFRSLIHTGFCYISYIVSAPSPLSLPPHSDPAIAVIIARLQEQIDAQARQIECGARELEYARLKIQVLEEHLRLRRIAKYGPGSETLSNLQLELLEQEPAVSSEEVQAESRREAPPSSIEGKKQRKKHPGRQTLPAALERVEKIIACAPEQYVCGSCGKETVVIGYEESEVLDVEPARYFVELTRREKRACKRCEEQGVVAAPLPARILDKSLVSDRIIIDTIVSKYTAHLPLYRQSALLERDCGIAIGRATMCGWVMTVGEMLTPVIRAMRKELLAGTYIQADETPVDVQTHDKRGSNHQAYLWQYGTPGGAAVFDFRMSRGREAPARWLGEFAGILQTDGYAAYDRGVGGPGMVHAACWSHARRHFVDAVKLNKQDEACLRAVELMDALFAIDREARERNLDHAARHLLRHEKRV